ncbi:class V lanthionine synthetase subunit LxmK [Streptomyces sp. NRRL F-5650]|uniref:class V lanthionine synthetase subunit LxmK n=1 Tax=Streptomyces sp. NRRL F-5650 TaxID=1463868 RepID=UPI0004CA4BA2|nr:class V lanthionine synthetase subunit LxmK [Streptomyces sp. NRRL F-5650]
MTTGGHVLSRRSVFAPVDLEAAPEVNDVLTRIGVGRLVTDDVDSLFGRNENWAGTTTVGVGVFVKRVSLDGGPEDAALRLARSRSFAALIEEQGSRDLMSPQLIGFDTASRVLVYRLLDNTRTFAELVSDDEADPALARRAGRATAALHSLDADGAEPPVDRSPFPFPSLGLMRALPLAGFMGLTFAETSLWQILHGDPVLARATERLRAAEDTAPVVPAHCDLRFDQFLRSDGDLYLTDGEEFRLADAARDVGAMAGEWLYRAVTGLTGRDEEDLSPADPTHEEIVARGVRELDRARPLISAFWSGYRSVRPGDAELAVRATAFAGWHMIDRAMATAARASTLPAVARAAMGIGRNALLNPETFVSALGLEETG